MCWLTFRALALRERKKKDFLANARNLSQHTLNGVQHIHINLTLIHWTSVTIRNITTKRPSVFVYACLSDFIEKREDSEKERKRKLNGSKALVLVWSYIDDWMFNFDSYLLFSSFAVGVMSTDFYRLNPSRCRCRCRSDTCVKMCPYICSFKHILS